MQQLRLAHYFKILRRSALFAAILIVTGQSFAGTMLNSCYDIPGVQPPAINAPKALYVFIDQTMALTPTMKASIIDLVSQWGSQGERVAISRFSANISGHYTELVFDEIGNIPPSEAYLFHLRRKHKKQILACLQQHKDDFRNELVNVLSNTLKLTDDKLPKTNLINALNDFANKMVAMDSIQNKTILLISDGLENSDIFSFHKRGKINTIKPKNALNKVRRKGLIPNWHGATVYFFGLGYISDEKFYVRPKLIEPLKRFWERFFAEGGGIIKANSIGTPMLLTKSILN